MANGTALSRRRLAFVIHDLNPWGGHDRSTLEIARRLSHRWPVDLCTYALHDPRGMQSWGKDVRLRRIRPDPRHPAIARHTLFYAASLGPLRALPRLKGEPLPLIHATGACSLVSDVVQVQYLSAAWQKARETLDPDACRAPRSRSMGRLGGKAVEAYHELLLRYNVAVERAVYTKEKTYIAIAGCVARELREHFGLERNIHVIHHGVDSEAFRPVDDSTRAAREELRAELGFSPRDVVFAFVGAYERKGLARAIDALGLLDPEARARVALLAVGSGDTQAFAARAERAGARVRFVGHTREVERYYRASDAFLLPTLYEPFGLVIIEAMACGLAPVVSRLAGASELLAHQESGMLLDDPMDAAEIARAIASVAGDPALRATLGRKAREIAARRTWDQVAREYEAVIAPLIEDGGEGRGQ